MFNFLKMEKQFIGTPQIGKVVTIEKVPDEVFSQKLLGEGFAVQPVAGEIYAPVSGRLAMVTKPSLHAYGIETKDGLSVLLHIGVDTVELKGLGFESYVQEGDWVTRGELLGKVDFTILDKKGYIYPMIVTVTNSDCLKSFKLLAEEATELNSNVLEYSIKQRGRV